MHCAPERTAVRKVKCPAGTRVVVGIERGLQIKTIAGRSPRQQLTVQVHAHNHEDTGTTGRQGRVQHSPLCRAGRLPRAPQALCRTPWRTAAEQHQVTRQHGAPHQRHQPQSYSVHLATHSRAGPQPTVRRCTWFRPQGSKREGMSSRSAPAVIRCAIDAEKPTHPRHWSCRQASISLRRDNVNDTSACRPQCITHSHSVPLSTFQSVPLSL